MSISMLNNNVKKYTDLIQSIEKFKKNYRPTSLIGKDGRSSYANCCFLQDLKNIQLGIKDCLINEDCPFDYVSHFIKSKIKYLNKENLDSDHQILMLGCYEQLEYYNKYYIRPFKNRY